MTTETPSIAIVGCGAICEFLYLPALKEHPEIAGKLTIVDTNDQRLQTVENKLGKVRSVNDYHKILGKVDGAIVATPHFSHHKIAIDFLREGTHVLCEKPLAVNGSDARDMVAQAERSGATLSVNNTRRLYPSFKAIRELILDGSLGRILSITYLDGEDFSGWPTATGFYFNKEHSTGVLLDQGAHALDVICWWIGTKPSVVSCQTDSFGGPEAAVSIKFQHAILRGEVRLSWLTRLQNRYRIEFENGYVSGGTKEPGLFEVALGSRKSEKRKVGSNANLHQTLVDNFLNVVSGREKPLIPSREIIPSIELIEESYTVATKFDMPWCDNIER